MKDPNDPNHNGQRRGLRISGCKGDSKRFVAKANRNRAKRDADKARRDANDR